MNQSEDEKAMQYLAELRSSLGPMPLAERDEILREIAAHIRDCAEESGGSVVDVLARLGSPRELAAEYRSGTLIRKASRSFSPLVLLRATGRLATKSIAGAAIFVCALIGYSFGGGLVLSALLKPFLPPNLTGLWIGPHTFGFGIGASAVDHPGLHEVLGVWYIPVALAAGGILLQVTTLVLRKLIWLLSRARSRSSAHWTGREGVLPVH